MRMRLFAFVLIFAVLPSLASTYVAVVETIAEKGVIGRSEQMFLTDELRKSAKKALPEYMGFVIMTRENIQQMLPPGKKIEDCEGECLVETGKNINADYIAQARVGMFGKSLTLTVEFYETRGSNLVGSFTARKPDAEGLLEEIEQQAEGMFSAIAGGNQGSVGGAEGFSGMNLGNGGKYQAKGTKSYIVNVTTNPTGAFLSVDGRPDADCGKTPCDITLSAGSHRLSFGMKMYFDKDSVIEVNGAGQKLSVNLVPNFGTLTLAPRLQSGVGDAGDLAFEIDGEKVSGKEFRLASGMHKVSISHRCYEKAFFDVNIKSNSRLVFDQELVEKKGGIKLNVKDDGKPLVIPVFVNGTRVGETPFLEAVPICSKITIGEIQEEVKATLKENETIEVTHDLGGVSSFVDDRDGQKYKTIRIGSQTWMAENLKYKTMLGTENRWVCYSSINDEFLYEDALDACPNGWHLPSDEEWNELLLYAQMHKDSTISLTQSLITGKWRNASEQDVEDDCDSFLDGCVDSVLFQKGALVVGYDQFKFSVVGGSGTTLGDECREGCGGYGFWVDLSYFWSTSKKMMLFSLETSPKLIQHRDPPRGIDDCSDGFGNFSRMPSIFSLQHVGKSVAAIRCIKDGKDDNGFGSSNSKIHQTNSSSGFTVDNNSVKKGIMTDKRDGQRYKTIKVGNQVWMAQNLNYKADSSYCYNNDKSKCKKYGRLYQWNSAMKSCPNGWHLPSKSEFENLLANSGGKDYAGKILKSKTGWADGDNGTDALSFSALAAGDKLRSDYFYFENIFSGFWSASLKSDYYALGVYLFYGSDAVEWGGYEKKIGLSVRCVKD